MGHGEVKSRTYVRRGLSASAARCVSWLHGTQDSLAEMTLHKLSDNIITRPQTDIPLALIFQTSISRKVWSRNFAL